MSMGPPEVQTLDAELLGVLDRVDELCAELATEYGKCAETKKVTERARNIFHDVLVKVRAALDMVFHRIVLKYAPCLPACRARTGRANFPICDTEADFRTKLGRAGLGDLEAVAPALCASVRQAQPFATGRSDLIALRNLANMGKHEKLALQTCTSRPAKRVTSSRGTIIYTRGVSFLCKEIIGIPVNEETNQPREGKEWTHEDIEWVSFDVEGLPCVDPVVFCWSLSKALRQHLSELCKLL